MLSKPIMLGLKPDPPKEERLRKTASASFNIVDRICMTFPDSYKVMDPETINITIGRKTDHNFMSGLRLE